MKSDNAGRFTHGLSPQAYGLAFFDWASHLATAQSKQVELFARVPKRSLESAVRALKGETQALAKRDPRFASPAWDRLPFQLLHQFHSFQEAWIDAATTDVPGVERHHEQMVNTVFKQVLSTFSPSTLPILNPDVLQETFKTRGKNLVRGFKNFAEDRKRSARGLGVLGSEEFKVGEKLAVTPGKVILRNELIELIQYAPSTPKVTAEPILIVPAWIMKYYILDLSPENSLVKYLVDQGHTVFAISWKNPRKEEQDFGFQAYLESGIEASIQAIQAVTAGRKIHAVGYCLGGTLLSIAASAMARDGDDRLASVSLFAAQTDFTEAGEIRNFIDESQVAALEADMNGRGYLDGSQMGGAFSALRPYELIWSRVIREYFLGQRQKLTDLLAWNADTTRLPARMHSEYLRSLYMGNDLAQGRFRVKDKPIAIQDLRIPLFVVGTETDHVAPWVSVFKIHLLSSTELTFVLTSGGHNAGIVSEPGHPRRRYRIRKRDAGQRYRSASDWLAETPSQEGSWWPAWNEWLNAHSSTGGKIAPPALGNRKKGYAPIADAPGEYVFA
jgi:polyhydroxyalkanoate synthase